MDKQYKKKSFKRREEIKEEIQRKMNLFIQMKFQQKLCNLGKAATAQKDKLGTLQGILKLP